MATENIIHVAPAQLRPHPRNPRTHSKQQIDQIAASIERFGFNVPVLIDARDRIVCGHARVAAAKQLGLAAVPAVSIEHLSDADIRAFIIADNKLAEKGGWDLEILGEELQFLTEVDIDPTITGFETPEIDLLIEGMDVAPAGDPETAPEPNRDTPAVTEHGDLWVLGDHRVMCGDATEARDVGALMAGAAACMVFVDPPYNVPIKGHVSGKGKVRHREFAMASGDMDEAVFMAFLEQSLNNLAGATLDGGLLYVCMDWRHLLELQTAARGVGLNLINLCVWAKTNAGMGSLYRSQHELILVFKSGTARHINNVELGRHGRNRTNVWSYAGVNTFRDGRDTELAMHPTVKPVALVADAIRDVTHRGDIVVDTFAGSGSTIIACEQVGRRGYAMELDPLYVDTAICRWQAETGADARLQLTGESFAEVSDRRTGVSPQQPAPAHEAAADCDANGPLVSNNVARSGSDLSLGGDVDG